MLNDLRQALRLFGRAPGFAAAAVVSIGLAIGANAAIFSLADALFLRPLDVPDPSGARHARAPARGRTTAATRCPTTPTSATPTGRLRAWRQSAP